MKKLSLLLVPAVLALPLVAKADPDWKHGRGHERQAYKQEFWDGPCKVERKYGPHGQFKEERKCKGTPMASYRAPQPVYVQPAPVYVQPAPVVMQPAPVYVPQPPMVMQQPGITIRAHLPL